MRTEQEIRDRINELQRDLANITVIKSGLFDSVRIRELRAQIEILNWVLESPDMMEKIPEPFTITDIAPE